MYPDKERATVRVKCLAQEHHVRCRKAGFTCTCPSLTVTGVTNNIANFKQKKGENVQIELHSIHI